MCCCHDKRVRVFRLLCDRFPQYLALFSFFVPFSQNGRLFVFLRNIHSAIEILRIKILEYSYPPSQYFFVNKAFIRLFSSRRKVALCLSGRMAHKCDHCKSKGKHDDTTAIGYEKCGNWFHGACVSLSADEASSMSKIKNCLWICDDCLEVDIFKYEA